MGLKTDRQLRIAHNRLAFAEIIRERRESIGWTMSDLARHADLSCPTISRLEQGSSVSRLSVYRVCYALNIPKELADDCLYSRRQLPLPGF